MGHLRDIYEIFETEKRDKPNMDNIEEKIQIIDNCINKANSEIGRINDRINENLNQMQKLNKDDPERKDIRTLKNENEKLRMRIEKLQEQINKCEEKKAESFHLNEEKNHVSDLPDLDEEEEKQGLLGSFFGSFKKTREIVDAVRERRHPHKYSFSILNNTEESKKSLTNGKISDELKKAFSDKGYFLSRNAVVSAINEKNWNIKDGQKRYYLKDNGNLDVYLPKYELETEKLGKGWHAKVYGVSPKDGESGNYEFAAKIPKMERKIREKEYLAMLEFQKILPKNLPKVYGYDKDTQTLIMEKINGLEWKNIPEKKLLENIYLIRELGRIIAIMHNHNFIHGDLCGINFMLNEENIWKIIDFGNAYIADENAVFDYQKFELNEMHITCLENKTDTLRNEFYGAYLLNRDISQMSSLLTKKYTFKKIFSLFELILFATVNITSRSNSIDNYLFNLLTEIRNCIKKHQPKNKELKNLFEEYIEKIRKNPNIHLTFPDQLNQVEEINSSGKKSLWKDNRAEAFPSKVTGNEKRKILKSPYYSLAVDNEKYEKYRDLINAILLKVTALNRKRLDSKYKNKTSELKEKAEDYESQLKEILAMDDEELTIPFQALDRDMKEYIRSLDEEVSQTKKGFGDFLRDKKASLFPGTTRSEENTEESREELRYQIDRVIEEIDILLEQSKKFS